jgi:hypothetical protein
MGTADGRDLRANDLLVCKRAKKVEWIEKIGGFHLSLYT